MWFGGADVISRVPPKSSGAYIVVAAEGPEQAVSVVRGDALPLREGVGFAVYEKRREADGREVEEYITVIPDAAPVLYAVSDAQFNTWKNRRFVGRPVRLEKGASVSSPLR